jgi:hypothetical protein
MTPDRWLTDDTTPAVRTPFYRKPIPRCTRCSRVKSSKRPCGCRATCTVHNLQLSATGICSWC